MTIIAYTYCFLYTIGLIALYLIIRKSTINDYDRKVGLLVERVKSLKTKTNELNDRAFWLDERVKETIGHRKLNEEIHRELEIKNDEVVAIHTENVILFEMNKVTLKDNKAQLYSIREASIFAYQHYKSMSDLFRHLLILDDGSKVFAHIRGALRTVELSTKEVSEYFEKYFKQTPMEYQHQKKNITGKKLDGADFVSDSSVN